MKKLKLLFIKLLVNSVFICTTVSVTQCCYGKFYQIPETKEFREKVRNKVKNKDNIVQAKTAGRQSNIQL